MPGLTGIELAIRVRALCPECKVLLLSGHTATLDLIQDAKRAGHHFEPLSKPIYPADLLLDIERVLNQRPISSLDWPHPPFASGGEGESTPNSAGPPRGLFSAALAWRRTIARFKFQFDFQPHAGRLAVGQCRGRGLAAENIHQDSDELDD